MSDAVFEISAEMASSEASLEAAPKSSEFQYERSEWVLFRSANTLTQKAGVPASLLRRLVLKELADNALDAGANVQIGRLTSEPGYFVQDDGPGMDPERVAKMFSINRPLVSSKLLRMPSRGAMGNGLRVVTGSVVASEGSLRVFTRNRRLALEPQEDGSTRAVASDVDFPAGMRVEIVFGDAIEEDPNAMAWARSAARMGSTALFRGKSSPWWYDTDAFFELLQAAGRRPLRNLIADLDGCSGPKAGRIASPFKGKTCVDLTRADAASLLTTARQEARPVRSERFVLLGPDALYGRSYDCQFGTFTHGAREPLATIPFAVEAWVRASPGSGQRIEVFVNRTPIVGQVRVYREKGNLELYGAGLAHAFEMPKADLDIIVNVTTPYCPITTDGKEPDLKAIVGSIMAAIQKAARRARKAFRGSNTDERLTAKAVVLANLPEAIRKASGDGAYRFNLRQLFYVVRPAVMAATGAELSYKHFEGIITDYEAETGDVPGMYRDPRGSLYHPHTGETIPLGTLAVEAYQRPEWTFNRILYIEKEGPFEALKAARWPERHDCALLTSKGFTTRAVKDLLDLLADDGEPIQIFCIHDADASGTMIYQTLQEETRARPARRTVEIVNLGLDPWEAVGMGLEVEGVEKRSRSSAVAQYLLDRSDGAYWRTWLDDKRVELNAMTTPAFIAWLDAKMAEHAGGKVQPPDDVLADELQDRTAEHLRRTITARVIEEANVEGQVQAALARLPDPDGDMLGFRLTPWLESNGDKLWRVYIDDLARDAASLVGGAR